MPACQRNCPTGVYAGAPGCTDCHAATVRLRELYAEAIGDVPNIPLDFTPPTMSHPNRNPNSATASPKGARVRAARMAANLTAGAAGALVYERATRWLAFEEDRAHMHPAAWELFNLKLAQRLGDELRAARLLSTAADDLEALLRLANEKGWQTHNEEATVRRLRAAAGETA